MRHWTRVVPLLLLASALVSLLAPRGQTIPLYAARTGLLCQTCHFDPNGGGPRTEFGFNFAKNRHALEAEPDAQELPWGNLDLTNRVGEKFPLYISINQRFMLLANTTIQSDSLDRAGFYNMENAFHMAFQPYSKLTLVYSRDGFDAGSSTKDAFGLMNVLPNGGYLKAGRFRTPFGLRMDDHTVATRNSFLDLYAPSVPFFPPYSDSVKTSFLPYDPRASDEGLEVGGEYQKLFGRAAWTNGQSSPLGLSPFAGAGTVKLGYHDARYEVAASLYDDYRKESGSGIQRATRWGMYGMTHLSRFSALGEIAAGTDVAEPTVAGTATGPRTNSIAWWLELDDQITRGLNARLRWDRMTLDRSSDPYIRDLNTHQRAALEIDWTVMPFAELRWAIRRIEHEADVYRDGNITIPDETQSFVQFHFTY